MFISLYALIKTSMGRNAVFINMGFDPTASLDIVSAMSLSSGDMLIAVYPKSGDEVSRLRSEQARTQIKGHVNMLKAIGRDIKYEELELNLDDMASAIDKLLDFIERIRKLGYRVYFELTGGIRAITVIMVLVSIWFSSYVDEITFIVEVTRERIRLPVISPLDVSNKPVKDVLRFMSSGSAVRRRDLCTELGVSESSVSRAVSSLKKLGIVDEELRVISINDKFRVLAPIFKRLADEFSDS